MSAFRCAVMRITQSCQPSAQRLCISYPQALTQTCGKRSIVVPAGRRWLSNTPVAAARSGFFRGLLGIDKDKDDKTTEETSEAQATAEQEVGDSDIMAFVEEFESPLREFESTGEATEFITGIITEVAGTDVLMKDDVLPREAKHKILADCIAAFGHDVPNTELAHINTPSDITNYFALMDPAAPSSFLFPSIDLDNIPNNVNFDFDIAQAGTKQ